MTGDPPRGRFAAVAEPALLVLAAVVWFATRTQWSLLNPFHVEWMLTGDWAATYHGWAFHVRGPFTLPPGLTPNLLAPYGTSVFYTASIFWVCELGRLIGLVVSRDFQLYGLFMASSYVGLALVGWWLMSRLGAPLVLRLAGGLLFMAEPMLMARFGHVALTGQWLVLLQVALGVVLLGAPRDSARLTALAALAAVCAIGVEGYLAAMSLPLAAANIVIARWRTHLPWRSVASSGALLTLGAVAMLWLVGGILGEPVDRTAEGFGDFSADLATLINSHGLSRFVPGLPVSARQGEGFGYLGLGTIVLCVTALAAWVTTPRQPLQALWWLAPLVAVVLGQAVYAASARVTFSGRVLFELWGFFTLLDPLPSMFRTGGRFIWPLHYLVVVSAVIGVVFAARRNWLWGVSLVLAAGLQLAEIPGVPTAFTVSPRPPPLGPAWTGLGTSYRHLQVVPVQVQWVCGYDEVLIGRLSEVAIRERMTINSGLVGRVPAAIRPLCTARLSGPVRADTVYVVDANFVADFHGARCGGLDGVPVCVAAQTPLGAVLPTLIP